MAYWISYETPEELAYWQRDSVVLSLSEHTDLWDIYLRIRRRIDEDPLLFMVKFSGTLIAGIDDKGNVVEGPYTVEEVLSKYRLPEKGKG